MPYGEEKLPVLPSPKKCLLIVLLVSEYCKGHQEHVKTNSKFLKIRFQVDPYKPNMIVGREPAVTKMEMGTGICIIVDWLKRWFLPPRNPSHNR